MSKHTSTVRLLAQRFIERSKALGYKDVKRDNAALDYFVGAAGLAEIAGDKSLATYLGFVCAMMISVHGFFAVNELAETGGGLIMDADRTVEFLQSIATLAVEAQEAVKRGDSKAVADTLVLIEGDIAHAWDALDRADG